MGSNCINPLKSDSFPFCAFKAQVTFTIQLPEGVEIKELRGPEIRKLFHIILLPEYLGYCYLSDLVLYLKNLLY